METNRFAKELTRIHFGLILLVGFTIPLSSYVSIRLLLLAVVVALLKNGRWAFGRLAGQPGIIIYLSVLAFAIIYSSDKVQGFRILETSASLILVPVAFLSDQSTIRNWRMILYSFLAGLILASVLSLGHAAFQFYNSGNINYFFHYQLTGFLRQHPTYVAYFLIFGITWLLYEQFFSTDSKYTILRGVVVTYLFSVLLLTGGHTTFVSLLLVFFFFLLKYFLEGGKSARRIAVTWITLMIVVLFLFRFLGLDRGMTDSWERVYLWEAAFRVNKNIILGQGTGDFQRALNEYYQSHDMPEQAALGFNTHNQFVQLYISNGMVGLIALLFMLMLPVYRSFKKGVSLGILFCFPFIIYGVTEVFLGREHGVMFFALVNQLVTLRLIADEAQTPT